MLRTIESVRSTLHTRFPFFISAVAVVLICAWNQPAIAQSSSPEAVYSSFAQAIDTAQGNCYLEFNGGKYRSTVPGNGLVEWTIADGTIGQVTFLYTLGSLQSLTIDFDSPVMMHMLAPHDVCIRFTHIRYNKLGGVAEWDARPCGNVVPPSPQLPSPGDMSMFKEHSRIGSRTDNLLLGSLLDRQVSITPVTGSSPGGDTPPANPLKSVEFRTDPMKPALLVTFKDQSQIDFGKKQPMGSVNTVTLSKPSYLQLDYAKYNCLTKFAYASLRRFTLRRHRGNSPAAKLRLLLAREPRLTALTSTLIPITRGAGRRL